MFKTLLVLTFFIPLHHFSQDTLVLRKSDIYIGVPAFTPIEEEISEYTSAQYPEGDEAMFQFIRNNLKHPEEAKQKGFKGTVYIKLMIDQFGSITSTETYSKTEQLLNNEAVRVINLMPNWTPAKKGEIPVESTATIPITFKLK